MSTLPPLRAILVSVDYADVLRVTLPYNRHHFSDVMVVTTPEDLDTQRVCVANRARTFRTLSFYEEGAEFNKWLALEEALEEYGREGWMCLMDADVLWPKKLPPRLKFEEGNLYVPRRRIMEAPPIPLLEAPEESLWGKFRFRRMEEEFAGYSQIFHANDPSLGEPPWHETNWRHAGGADSFFWMKWPRANLRRPNFEVLHLGPTGANWCGRATTYLDGSGEPPNREGRIEKLRDFFRKRVGKKGDERYRDEKLSR